VNSKATRNFELDKMVRHVRNAQGNITRVSAAVVIKERVAAKEGGTEPAQQAYSAEEIERLGDLVKGVVGFRQERGDVVSLVPARFEPPGSGPVQPWYENEKIMSGIKLGVGVLVLLVILLAVVRPAIRAISPPPPVPVPVLPEAAESAGSALAAPVEPEKDGMTMAEGESLEDFKQRLKKAGPQKRSGISADMLDTANTYDDKVALIRMLVQEDSGRVASVLKGMIKRDLKL